MSEEVCASRLQRERAKVSVLEQLIEDQTRRLFLANADLRRRQEHLETVYRVIPGAILVFDDADRVELANEACEELFGGAPEGIPIDEFTHEPLPPLDSSDRREIDLCRLDGSIVPVMLSRRRWSDGPGQVWVAIDLTDQRRMEADLRQSQKLQSIGTLAAGVAHELNTPIQYIQDNIGFVAQATENLFGLLTAARDRLPDEEAKAKFDDDCARMDLDFFREELPDALSALRFGAERMKTIVAAMKSLSHPQPAQMAYYDINRGIRDVAVIASSEYKYVAKLELELGELPRVKCRADDLNTVFLNMIVNAAHAIKDANRGLGRIRVSTRELPEHVEVHIADNGTGIPEAIRERIFDPFFTTKAVGMGTGQGLAMAHSIVSSHGGHIEFDTQVGKGTEFIIELPKSPRQTGQE